MFLNALKPALGGGPLGPAEVEAMLTQMEMAMQSMEDTTQRVADRAKSGDGRAATAWVAKLQSEVTAVFDMLPDIVRHAVDDRHPILHAAMPDRLTTEVQEFILHWANGVRTHGPPFEDWIRDKHSSDPAFGFLRQPLGAEARFYRQCLSTGSVGGGGGGGGSPGGAPAEAPRSSYARPQSFNFGGARAGGGQPRSQQDSGGGGGGGGGPMRGNHDLLGTLSASRPAQSSRANVFDRLSRCARCSSFAGIRWRLWLTTASLPPAARPGAARLPATAGGRSSSSSSPPSEARPRSPGRRGPAQAPRAGRVPRPIARPAVVRRGPSAAPAARCKNRLAPARRAAAAAVGRAAGRTAAAPRLPPRGGSRQAQPAGSLRARRAGNLRGPGKPTGRRRHRRRVSGSR